LSQQHLGEQIAGLHDLIDQLCQKYQQQPTEAQPLIEAISDQLSKIKALQTAEEPVARAKIPPIELVDLAKFPEENPNPILRLDRKGVILYANAASQLLLEDWGCEVGQPAPAVWSERIQQAAASGEKQAVDIGIAGQWFTFLIVPIPQAGYVNLYGRDINERVQMEQRLAEQAGLFETVQDAIIATDVHFTITSWNQAAEALYGWSQAEAVGKNVSQLLRSGLADLERETALQQMRQTGMTMREIVHHAKDGRRLIVENHTRVRLSLTGEVIGFINSNRDITERKQIEAERERLLMENRRQAALLDGVFEADPSGLAVVVGPELRFAYVNPAYRYLTPDPVLNPIDQPYDRVWPHKSPAGHRDHFREVLRTGQPFQETGIEYHFLDGSMRNFTVQARRIGWENQLAVLLTFWDTTEIHQTAHELRKSETRLKAAQEIAHVGSWELDLITGRLIWSDEIYRIFGLAPQEFGATYEAFLAAIHPQDRVAVDAAYTGSLQAGRNGYEIEHRVVRRSTGEVRFVHEKCDHIRDKTGHIVRSVGMVQDITERKRAETALRESEQKFLAIFQNSPFAISLSNQSDGIIVDVNQAALELFEYAREEVIGQTSVELNVFADNPTRNRLLTQLRQNGKIRNHETAYQTPGGETRYLSINIDPLSVGEQQYMLSTIENITTRKQAELGLAHHKQRLEDLLASIQDGFFELDREWRFTFLNDRAASIGNFAPQELVGEVIWNKWPLMVGSEYERIYRRVMDTRQAERRELKSLLRDIWFGLTVNPSSSGITVYWQDITERKQAEAERRTRSIQIELQHRLLEQREQERLQIAHDLHDGPVQYLTGITLALRGVLMDRCTPEMAQSLEAIQTGLQDQIGELRTYAGELRPPSLSKFGLGKAIRSHLDSFQDKHPGLQVTFNESQPGDRFPEEVRLALFRIYQESLNNIVKHAQAPTATIWLQQTQNQVILKVVDTGVGFEIPQDWLELARHNHLGLVGMRERAEAVGGQVEILSQKGAGTQVWVTVPLNRS
jgi:PAS domain S-box-containing protein